MFWGGDLISTIIWFVFIAIFFFLGPRIMFSQLIANIEREVAEMEELARSAERKVIISLRKNPSKTLRKRFSSFLDFFSVYPVDLDPNGIIRKLDHLIKNSERKIRGFIKSVSPNINEIKMNDFRAAISGAITARQIAKIVRHYLETIKKYKMLQLALLLQMQIPLIKNLLKASVKATEAFLNEFPIGDSIGPLIAARFMEKNHRIYKKEEFIVAEGSIEGKKIFVAKALGPGATVGFPGKFLKKFIKAHKINRIITIDAALKLEGEKTGSVAEGVGVAMGGIGVERYEIEEIAVKNNIALDAIAVKQSQEESLQPMKMEILKSSEEVVERIKEIIKDCKRNENVLIIGVGNTCGIGNNPSSAKSAEEKIRKYNFLRKRKKEKEKSTFFHL